MAELPKCSRTELQASAVLSPFGVLQLVSACHIRMLVIHAIAMKISVVAAKTGCGIFNSSPGKLDIKKWKHSVRYY